MLTRTRLDAQADWNAASSELTIADLALAYRKAKVDAFYERAVLCRETFAQFEFGAPGSRGAQSAGHLQRNLQKMLERLKSGDLECYLSELALSGSRRSNSIYEVLPKSLKLEKKQNKDDRHLFISDGKRAFDALKEDYELHPDLRLIGNFPVELHVLSALWVNIIGHRIDACLSTCAYGSRLRRIAQDPDDEVNIRRYHDRAPGLFEPYIYPYKRWRDGGTRAIESQLEDGQRVIVVSMDLKSYYPSLDLNGFRALGDGVSNLWGCLDFKEDVAGKEPLARWEAEFTQWLLNAIGAWQNSVQRDLEDNGIEEAPLVGLPIGLSAARLLANAYLHRLDLEIAESLTPIYYGRYVDDLLLVLSDPGNLELHSDVLRHLEANVGCICATGESGSGGAECSEGELGVGLDYSSADKTKLRLQRDKMRIFLLSGKSGKHMLESIQSQLREISSERRFMPEPNFLERGPAAEVLTAAATAEEEPDGLRQAEGLSIKRLSWSVLLHKAERLSVDLRSNEWKADRQQFYEFAQEHVLRPDRILSHWDTLHRLIGLATWCGDDKQAALLVQRSMESLRLLEETVRGSCSHGVRLNGDTVAGSEGAEYLFKCLKQRFLGAATEALISNWPWNRSRQEAASVYLRPKALSYWKRRVWKRALSSGGEPLSDAKTNQCWGAYLRPLVRQVAEADLARMPRTTFRSLYGIDWSVYGVARDSNQDSSDVEPFRDVEFAAYWSRRDEEDVALGLDPVIKEFLTSTSHVRLAPGFKETREPVSAHWFPTRPYSVRSIAEYAPWCLNLWPEKPGGQLKALGCWARYAQALRGVWVKPSLLEDFDDGTGEGNRRDKPRRCRIGSGVGNTAPRIALTNLRVDYEYWRAAASGKPIESKERYAALARVVRQIIKLKPRPTYAVFPELSIPKSWVHSLSNTLLASGISVIAGVEYFHVASDPQAKSGARRQLRNSACLALTDDRLGYQSSAIVWHPKGVAAPEEEHELLSKFGNELDGQEYDNPDKRPVISHDGFEFGILICSELLNIKHRAHYQGEVDCLFILSWNQDLRTFSSMVESAAQDVHAYTVIVNNREYGDSRARIPAKVEHKRDLCRIRGGENDYAVMVTLDIEKLRRFQSRTKRWTDHNDPFKPTPEGYHIRDYRKKTPK